MRGAAIGLRRYLDDIDHVRVPGSWHAGLVARRAGGRYGRSFSSAIAVTPACWTRSIARITPP
jgi:hypothetical protein